METKNILDVEKFVVACNDLLSGKFLDLNKRLDKFLSVMTQSDDVLDLLADCLDEFDDEAEFVKAFSIDKKTGAAKIEIPSDDKKRLALTVTIFNDLSNGKLNTNQFLETYFQREKATPIQNFLEEIVRPYRDLICKNFSLNTNITIEDVKRQIEEEKVFEKEEEKKKEEQQFPNLDELLADIVKSSNQILAILKFEKKRTDKLDDLEFVVNSIIQACDKRDLMVINGLVIGLNYVSKKFKNVKHLVEDLNNKIYDYYEFLAGGNSADDNGEEE
jgi:tetrahydromethanopterin S-methyltransferase subunit G